MADGGAAARFRAEFPALADTVHLASCSQGALSGRLTYALQEIAFSLRDKGAPWEDWVAEVERARAGFARFIGAEPGEIAVLSCASEAAYQVASSMDWARRAAIVTTDLEFPSIAQVWRAQGGRGASVRVARDNGTTVTAEGYAEQIDEDVNLVSVPMALYGNGARPPVREVVELAHERGARVFVDAYQGTGVLPVDVHELGCDYLASGSLKYLLGLPGIAFLYVRAGTEHQRDPELTGWFGRRDPFSFDPRLVDFPAEARRFETGTHPIPSAYAANAGLELLAPLDMATVFEHVSTLAAELSEQLAGDGEMIASPTDAAGRGPQVAIVDQDPDALARWLARRRIVTAPRGRLLRLSLHYYSDRSDVAAVVDAIRRYRKES
ncbi:aminotransferase class V-fold PLP-dependent enzyme [Pseudonocardia acaciae]|uniref:aminotransferase class V-fold PLP-dependent enzyme n=1 Tax=Pseudonocardia acaciae TaxID=551276 RepID=UPI00048D504D|nr:aminotransferase class V-fold PLP-dependent enzyme [Pseudonocardia acaciae]